MALFFKGKGSSPGGKPVKKRDMITLVCPQCQYEQSESRMAMSTYCRGCGCYYKIERGQALPRLKSPQPPFASPDPEPGKRRAQETGEVTGKDKPKHAGKRSTPAGAKTPGPAPEPRTHGPKTGGDETGGDEKQAPASKPARKKIPTRKVSCLDCDCEHDAPAEASSTLCPACGAYIALKDYVICDHWNQRIETRGDVLIQKKASVTGVTVRCHNIHVQGSLRGGIDCSGDCILSNHSKIIGKIRCKRLIVEKRAHTAFADEVECEDAIIDGNVTGHFICRGKLHLKRKAVLNGNVRVATMVIDKGARHNGKVSIEA